MPKHLFNIEDRKNNNNNKEIVVHEEVDVYSSLLFIQFNAGLEKFMEALCLIVKLKFKQQKKHNLADSFCNLLQSQ